MDKGPMMRVTSVLKKRQTLWSSWRAPSELLIHSCPDRKVFCSRSWEIEIGCEAKIWQTQISTKQTERPVPLWSDPLSDYHCLHSSFILESLIFSLLVVDYKCLLLIASVCCHFVLCLFWGATYNFCMLKFHQISIASVCQSLTGKNPHCWCFY